MIAIINNTKNLVSGENGLGSGTINIIDNYGDIGTIAAGTMPIFINEHNNNASCAA